MAKHSDMITSQRGFSFGPYIFAPRPLAALVVIILCGLLISLGCWQLRRAEFKQTITTHYQQRAQAAPLNWQQFNALVDPQYYQLTVNGQFANDHQILLDNRTYQQQAGYDVYTPFITNDNHAILVNRGWLARGNDRQHLPDIEPIVGTLQLTGTIHQPSSGFSLNNQPDSPSEWPARIQIIDIAALSEKLGYTLSPFILILDNEHPLSFVQTWQPTIAPARKHIGYAVQWFAFAAILLITFIVATTRKKRG